MADQLDVSRRQFVVLAATCAAACACGESLSAAPTTAPAAGKTVDIGTTADFAKDGVFGQFAKSNKVLVYREDGKIYASTALCTHRGAMLQVKDGVPYCPKHGSVFSEAGTVTKGPARDSLARYAISSNDQGHLVVDTAKTFHEKDWEDAASFVKVS